MRIRLRKTGFTLLEVLVASVIGAFIALVAVGTLRSVTLGRARLNRITIAADELRFAANIIQNDLTNLYRDSDSDAVVLVGIAGNADDGVLPSLRMRVISAVKARKRQPEGDVYEVEYVLEKGEDSLVLLRRLCPLVGNENREDSQGGMLVTIGENIADFRVLYFDASAEEWLDEWPETQTSLPGLVEVTLITGGAEPDSTKDVMSKSFTVGFPRMPRMQDKKKKESKEES